MAVKITAPTPPKEQPPASTYGGKASPSTYGGK